MPNATNLFLESGSAAGTVVLNVVGRAGTRGDYSYVYAQASFSTSSPIQDTYYSNYEVLDPNSDTIQSTNVSATPLSGGGGSTATPETQYPVSYSYVNGAGATVTVPPTGGSPPSLWQDLCQYDTYSPNNFIDALGTLGVSGLTAYSKSHPYYGPYFGNSVTFETNKSGVAVATGSATATTRLTVPSGGSLPCESPYDFLSGETFNGPVYSNDQLHVCGSPAFNGAPVSLTSGAPSDVPYLYNVPGSVLGHGCELRCQRAVSVVAHRRLRSRLVTRWTPSTAAERTTIPALPTDWH